LIGVIDDAHDFITGSDLTILRYCNILILE
jgi:hypothetical protein